MTITEELRARLDELGVEYTSAEDAGGTQHVWWSDGEKEVCAIDRGRMNDELAVYHLTPEQAIAATVGAGTCHMKLLENMHTSAYQDVYECDECGEQVLRETYMGESEPPKFCPECGRKVTESKEEAE